MSRGLNGRVAVVAGGAKGIGRAAARRLAQEGALVVIGDIDRDAAEATAAAIRASGGAASAAWFDLADCDSCRALFDAALTVHGRVELLFNVAADMSVDLVSGDTDVVDADIAVWDRTYNANLRGFIGLCRAGIPLLLRQPGGAIVNTSSLAAHRAKPHLPAYGVMKAGIEALTRHIAARWGRQGLRCNAIAPGFILTETAIALTDSRYRERYVGFTLSPRLGEPEDVAAVVALLLSDESRFINGQVIKIDGGESVASEGVVGSESLR